MPILKLLPENLKFLLEKIYLFNGAIFFDVSGKVLQFLVNNGPDISLPNRHTRDRGDDSSRLLKFLHSTIDILRLFLDHSMAKPPKSS